MCHPKEGQTQRKFLEKATTGARAATNVQLGGVNTEVEPELVPATDDAGIPALPLIIGAYSVISTLETSSIDFIAPPYLVVEVDDDGMMHVEQDVEPSKIHGKERIMWKWLGNLNPMKVLRIFLRALKFIFKQ